MTPGATRYAPGRGTAVCGPGVFGLLDATGTAGEPLQRVVDAVIAGDGVSAVVDRLVAVGVQALPDFALVFAEGERVRLLLRGDVVVATEDDHGDAQIVDGTDYRTWHEAVLTGTATIRLSLVAEGGRDGGGDVPTPFALVAGSAPAGALTHVFREPVRADAGVDAARRRAGAPTDAESTDGDGADAEPTHAAAVDAPTPTSAAVLPTAPAPATDDDFDFGHLLGDTLYGSVESGAVRPSEPGVPVVGDEHDDTDPDTDDDDEDEDSDTDEAPPRALTTTSADPLSRHTQTFESVARPDLEIERESPAPDPPAVPSRPGLISSVPGMPAPAADPSGGSRPASPAAAALPPRPAPVVRPPQAEPRPSAPAPSVPAPSGPPASAPAGPVPPVAPPAQPAPPTPPEPGPPASSPPRVDLGALPPPNPADRRPLPPPAALYPPPRPAVAAPTPPGPAARTPIAPAPGAPSSTAPASSGPDAEGPTIGVAALRALRAGSTVAAPVIQAVHCAEGHPNPPYAERCRRCDVTIADRSVTLVPRPCLGQLRFADGLVIRLDQPLLLGRRPPTDATVNGEPARSIAIQDGAMVLSRLHAEIRLVDWQVLVVDRDSMNHTFVEVPGHAPIQLRPAEPFPILLGSTVSLGDAVRATYEIDTP